MVFYSAQDFAARRAGAWGADTLARRVDRSSSLEAALPGRLLCLARAATRWVLAADGKAAMLVEGHGVWESSEHMPLERRLRASLGESRGVDEAPGLVGAAEYEDDLVSYFYLVLLFGWDARLESGDGRRCVVVTHDGRITACADDGIDFAVSWIDS